MEREQGRVGCRTRGKEKGGKPYKEGIEEKEGEMKRWLSRGSRGGDGISSMLYVV